MRNRIAAISAMVMMAAPAPAAADVRVTQDAAAGSFTRAGGGTDAVTERCSTGRRPQAEPGVAIDPRDPDTIVVAAHTNCPGLHVNVGYFDLGWAGLYRSTDGGRTWRASLVPGYPGDDSPEGMASPLRGMRQTAEHALDFDADGRLFVAHIGCNGTRQSTCRNFASVYEDGGSRYVRTVKLSVASPPSGGPVETGFGHWTSVAVDRSGGSHDGNVYVTWDQFASQAAVGDSTDQGPPVPAVVPVMSRSTDGGRTWSLPAPVMPPAGVPYSADVAVGPDGAVHVVARNVGTAGPMEDLSTSLGGTDAVVIASSRDGGVTFGPPVLVERMRTFDHTRYVSGTQPENPGVCGDGYFACDRPYTSQDNRSNAAVVADDSGVHVFFNSRRGPGQAKVHHRVSADGRTWSEPSRTLDDVPVGHQDRVEAASDGETITVAFMDSRADPSYDPDRPQGNTADGRTIAPFMDLWAARSSDGGRTWAERRLSSVTTNANLEVYESGRVAWNGDYVGVAAVPGRTFVAWTDNRDVRSGTDSRNPDDLDGNDVHLPCDWRPGDEDVRSYESPDSLDPCFSQGGTDQNVYGAAVTAPRPALAVRVRPRRVRAGRRASFAFTVRVRRGGSAAPARAALVRLGGARARTNRHGTARLHATLHRPGLHRARVALARARSASVRIRVLPAARATR